MQVGLIGWRGMVGSVLVQRMREERDFDLIDPVFFSTSQTGAAAPAIGKDRPGGQGRERSRGARWMRTCSSPARAATTRPTSTLELRQAGWDGYWIDAASTLRMKDDAVIVLDPVNRDVIDARDRSRASRTSSAATAPSA